MKIRECYVCGKDKLSRNEIGLSQKLLDREIVCFYCLGCIAEYLEADVEFLRGKIIEFKEQGCILF